MLFYRELLVLSMWQSVNIMYIICCYSTESYWYYQCGNPLTLCILYIVILQRATGTINVSLRLHYVYYILLFYRELLVLSMYHSVNIMYIIYCYSTESYWYYQCITLLTLCILYIVILQRATGTINVSLP